MVGVATVTAATVVDTGAGTVTVGVATVVVTGSDTVGVATVVVTGTDTVGVATVVVTGTDTVGVTMVVTGVDTETVGSAVVIRSAGSPPARATPASTPAAKPAAASTNEALRRRLPIVPSPLLGPGRELPSLLYPRRHTYNDSNRDSGTPTPRGVRRLQGAGHQGDAPAPLSTQCYSRISISWASRSRSTYGSPLTSIATRLIVPPLKRCGASPG